MTTAAQYHASEAARRIRQACSIIESAYRLCPDLSPQETLDAVRAAMKEGAEQLAADVHDAVDKAR